MAGNRDLSKFANQLFVDSNGNIGLATDVNIAIGHTNPSSKLDILGSAVISGDLGVTGQVSFQSNVTFNSQLSQLGVSTLTANDIQVNQSLTATSIASTSITSDTISTGTLTASGLSTFTSDVSFNSGINVSGLTQLQEISSTEITTGILTATSIASTSITSDDISSVTLNVSGVSTFSSNVGFNSDISVTGIASLPYLSSTEITTGILTATSIASTSITSDDIFAGALTVSGLSTFNSNTNFNGEVQFSSNIIGNTTINDLTSPNANITSLNSDNIIVSTGLSSPSIVASSITSTNANLTTVNGTTANFDNINSTNLNVSGIATFADDVNFSGQVVYTGVTTFSDGFIENLEANIVEVNNYITSNRINSDDLYVNLKQYSYSGTLVGISTNTISNTNTSNLLPGFSVEGTNVPQNTTIVSTSSSTVVLSNNSTNNIVTLQKTGIFESQNGSIILGITTSGIEVGYGISNANISTGTTVTSVGINSITISQNATNSYSKLIKEGTLSGVSTNVISGIDTSGIVLNQFVVGDFVVSQTTVSQIGVNEIVLSQNAFNTGVSTSNYEIYFIDNFELFSQEALTEGTFTYTKPSSGVGSIYTLSGNSLSYTSGNINTLTGSSLNYTSGTINTLQSGSGTILNLNSNNIESAVGVVSSISGDNLNYSGIGTINTLGVTSFTATSANIDNIEIGSVDVENLSGQDLNFTGIGTINQIYAENGTIGYFISTDISVENVDISGILTATTIYNTDFNSSYSNLGVSTISSATISDLIVTNSMEVTIGEDSISFGPGTIVSAAGTISDLNGNNLSYTSGIFDNLSSASIASTTITVESGDISYLNGVNIDYSGIGTFGSIEVTNGTISYLNGIDSNYIGISTFNEINAIDLTLTNELSANTATFSDVTITNSTIDSLSGTDISYNSGIITSLTGTDISYSGVGTFTTIEGVNLNYSGVGTITSLEGVTVTYTGDASFGNVIATGATFSNIVNTPTIDADFGNIEILDGNDISYNAGIITSLSGTNISYSGVGTISTLQGTDISYTGIGTFGEVGITTATIGTVNATNVSILGNLSVADLTVGIVTASSVITDNITSDEGTITSLDGQNLNYSGIGTITEIDSTTITSTNLETQDLNVTGIGTIPTLESTNINNSQDIRTDYIYSRVGIITELSGDIVDYNTGTIDNLSGVNLNYSGIGTINQIDVNVGSVDNLSGIDLNYSGIGTIQTVSSTQIENSANVVTDGIYSRVGVITELSGDTVDYNSGSVDNLSGVDLNYSGIGTINQIDVNVGSVDYLSGVDASYTGVSTFNVVGVTSLTSQSIFGSAGIITSLTGETLNFSNSAEISNVTIGLGNTELVVSGDARITDTLTIGPDSVVIDGILNSITGVSTLTSGYASISTITGSDSTYTNVNTDSLTFAGINTSNNFNTQVNIVASNSGLATSYNLVLPAQLGIPGTVLTLESDGNLGFTTAGLYENRIYVSPVNGDDSNDGKARPVRTIKRAAQLASFESFVLPGGRFLDAADLLSDNKDFIAAEVVGFVTTTYPSILSNPDYDEAICKRDIGYIVDAISYDLSYGGNSKTVEAGLAYWNAGTSYVDGESVETIAGYNHIITISKYIINNIDIPQSYQGIQTVFQTKDLSLAYDDDCNENAYSENCCADVWSAIGSFVGIVTSIIGIGTTAAPSVTLPTSKSTPVAVIVEAGEYVEDNPIILYEDVSIIGDNLRNTIIRPQNAGKDLFRVRNGCYLTGFALKDSVDPAGVPQFTFNNAVAFDDPSDPTTSREGYAIKETKPIITRSPYIQNCSILSFLGANGILVDGSKVDTLNTAIIPEESENPVEGEQPEFGKSMVAAAFTMVSFGGIGWRVINDGYSQVVSCFQIFCKYGSLAQSGGYLSITNSATNFGLYALRSTGYNQRSYIFDRGLVAATGTSGGLQTLKVIGLGRADQELYVLRFINASTGIDETSNFKLAPTIQEVDISVGVNTVTNTIGIQTHGFTNGDSVIYLGNETTIPPQVIGGLVNLNEYYVEYVSDDEFRLYEDDSLTRLVNLTSATSGINTFVKGNQEFFNSEMLNSHTSYQRVSLASTTATLNFVPGREVTQTVNGGTAVGIAYTYNSTSRELIVSVEAPGGIRNNFGVTGVGVNGLIQDHSGTPVSIGVTAAVGISTLHTVEFKVDSTQVGSQILGIGGLPENYRINFHRPSIINSSSHTWEFSGSGTDYNALPQNGGKTRPETEQVFSQGGRVYSSGTNELGDFKIGNFITAFNRTGNIIFNNKVSIGQLDSLRLSLSGGVAIEEFSTDIGLGDNEVGGPLDSRVSTQKAVRTFLNNRLGNFIDKDLSTNAVPSAVVQLNAFGQINADLIPPKVVNYYTADVGGGRTTLVDRIPAVDLRQGDTVVEPDFSYVLISDVYSQYLILSDSNRNYNFNNGDEVVSAVSNGGAIGIVTAPTSVGYGTTGLVKGVLLNGSLTSGGSGYTSAGIYTGVTLTSTSGIGTDAKAIVTVSGAGNVTDIDIIYGGRYYDENETLTVINPNDIGGRSGGSDFVFTVSDIETRLYIELTNNQKFTGSTLLNDYVEDGDATGISTSLTDTYAFSFDPTSAETGGDIDFTNDRIIIGTNNFSDGDHVIYSAGGGNVLEELISGDTYYIKRVGISSVELYTNYALSNKKNFLSSGTGTHSITRRVVNTAENKLTFVNHGYSTGDAVRVSGSVPGGITAGDYYFIGSVTTNGLTLHETQQTALASVNGLIFNAVDITSVGSGTFTLTKQNVQYTSTINTSSNILDNWTVLSSGTVDAANITTGTISPSRLGSGNANSDTFLGGDSVYRKAVKSVGIGTTTPMTITSSSFEVENGVTKHFGDLQVSLNRVEETLETYSTTGVAKFKTSTFDIGDDGAVSIKSSQFGDVDAATLGGFTGAYYLDLNNATGTVSIPRGGTGLSALPSEGYLLVGNGSAYTLTGDPTIAGTLTGEVTIKSGGDIELPTGTWTGEKAAKIQNSSNNLYLQYTTNLIGRNSSGTDRLTLTSGGDLTVGGTVTGTRLISNVANGTAPLTVTSSTVVTNLNADTVDGIQGASLLRSDANDTFSGTLTYSGSGTALNFTSSGEVILADHSSNSTPVPFDIRKSGSTLSDVSDYGILHLSRLNHNNSATSAGASLYFQLRDSGGTLREYAGISGQKTEAGAAGGRLQFYRYNRTSLGYWDSTGLYVGTDKVWHAGNDGPSSGLDADTLDTIQASSFLRSDASDSFSGTITGNKLYVGDSALLAGSDAKFQVNGFMRTGTIFIHSGGLTPNNTVNTYRLQTRDDGTLEWGTGDVGTANKIWHEGNDGSGSGLDADKLDNLDSTQFLRSDATDTVTGGSILQFASSAGLTRGFLQCTETNDAHFIIATSGGEDIAFKDGGVSGTTNMIIRGDGTLVQGTSNTIWHAGNDGPSSGLDADTLDTIQASSFLRSDENDTSSGYLGAEGFVGMGGGALRLVLPHGASYATTTSSVTGAIKVTLPVSWTNTMLRMTIKIYEYATGESFEVVCGGYNYDGNSSWINTFAYIISDPQVSRNFNVRFGHDGSKCCIYIGETNSTWSYPQVAVTEFEAGYSGYGEDTWNDNWSIGFATSLGTITSTLSNREIGKFVDGNTVWHAGNDGPSSGLDADTLDTIQASSFLRSDVNDSASGTYTFSGGGNDASNTPTLNLTNGYISVSHDEVLLKFDQGQKMITSNDGQGNFNIRAGHDNDAVHVDSASGTSGMAAITLDSDGTDGQIHLYVGPRRSAGSTANADYGLSIERGTSGLTWRTGSANYGASLATSYKVWHEGNDGSGSGLNADKLDDLEASQFLRSDANDTFTGDLDINGTVTVDCGNTTTGLSVRAGSGAGNTGRINLGFGNGGNNPKIQLDDVNNDMFWGIGAHDSPNNLYIWGSAGSSLPSFENHAGGITSNIQFEFTTSGNLNVYGSITAGNGNTVWHAGNDGGGSGLNADKLDDLEASQFLRSDIDNTYSKNISFTSTTTPITTNSIKFNNTEMSTDYYTNQTGVLAFDENFYDDTEYGTGTYDPTTVFTGNNGGGLLIKNEDGWGAIFTTQNTRWASAEWANLKIGSNQVWHEGNDGSGSGLNADKLDDLEASQFLRSDANDTFTGTLSYHSDTHAISLRNTSYDTYLYLGGWSNANSNNISRIRNSNGNLHIDSAANGNLYLNHYSTGTIYARGNTVWHAGNDGSGSGLDADRVDGYEASSLINDTHTSHSADNLAVGWYTIATNSGNRAIARFGLRDVASGDHQSCVFYASHHYGNNSEITILHSGRYSGNPFRYIRIREGGTYDGAMLQVYIDDASNSVTAYLLGDNFQSSGWVLKDWVANATNPGDVSNFGALTNTAAQVDIDQVIDGGMVTTGEIYAGGNTTQYKVYHTGNLSPLTTSTNFGGDVSGTYNNIVVADDSHNHIISNVDGLQTALDGKLSTTGKAADSEKLDGIDSTGFFKIDSDNTFTKELINSSLNQTPGAGNGVLQLQPSVNGGSTGIFFNSRVNANSDGAYIWWYDDNNNYRKSDSSENGALVIGIQNDGAATSEDAIAIESSGDIFLNPGNDGGFGNAGGATGPDFAEGKVYIGTAATKYEVYHTGNLSPLTTSTNFGGDVSGTYDAIVVANDSHTHDGRYYTESESNTRYLRRDDGNNVDIRIDSSDGRGLRFWDSNDYKIWMSSANNGTWGGRLDSTSDYNMYFRMAGGTNRGFVFKNGTSNVFQIESGGQVRTASNNIYANGNLVWHAGNDGDGSTLDADTVDGHNLNTISSPNLASSANWTVGTGNASDTGTGGAFGVNGDGNLREWNIDPFGRRGLIWVTRNNDTTSNDDGGWNKTITGLNANKSYMSVVYVKRATASTNGSFYHGCSGSTTLNLNGNVNGNPYFSSFGIGTLPQDVWCVSIGFIRANGDGNTSNTVGGLYRLDTGERVVAYTDYKMITNGTSQIHRTYLYYSTDPAAELHWWGPGFYEINGQEPSLDTLTGNSTKFYNGNIVKVWHEGNDGPDSGLNADNLDDHTWTSFGKNLRGTEIYADNWFRNYNSGEGIYNETTAMHWYSDSNTRWRLYSTQTTAEILFTTNGNTARGYVYANNSNQIGFLDSDGNWAVKVVRDSHVELLDNNEVTFRAGQGGVSGDYGTVETQGTGKGDWEGYSINGRYVFMSDDNETCGWYNDIDNRWIILYERNDYTDFYDPDGTSVWFRMDNGEMYSYIHNRFTDNDQVRLGSGADFRMWHNGSHHYFRNYNHGSGNIYWQGEDNEGTNHALLYMYTDGSRPYLSLYENGAERLRTTSTGVTVYGNLNSTSDERYKKNIERIENALNKIEQLEGVTFDWDNDAFSEGDGQDGDAVSKPDFHKRSTGVIAQKVESVLPEAVTEDPETGMKNVAYGNMIGLLIEGIKEMNQKLSNIEERLDKLEEKT